MSNSQQSTGRGHKHPGIGVTNFGIPQEGYVPNEHNRKAPLREGSQDAFKYPSLDHTGTRKPYWALQE